MELWRFNLQRQDADPQPAQWVDLLHAIKVPDTPNFRDVDTLRAQVEALPVRVAGVLNEVLFKRAEIGRVALFERMMRDATPRNATASPADVVLLRGALVDMIESLRYVRGRRGPKLKQDIGPVLRAVHAAIVTNSRMADVPARELAADLLVMCGIPAPKGRSRLSELFSPAR
ncbi:hypothetical protein CSC75_04395 [Pseudoxanthomonas wuyuanensis]|nr:hypothetical protein CSC75_04395 [Pseudoxanthomonas wuyuanensis]